MSISARPNALENCNSIFLSWIPAFTGITDKEKNSLEIITEDEIRGNLLELLTNMKLRKEMSALGRRLVDGFGRDRVIWRQHDI
ncbi:MAG: hypothetical protein HQK98_00260 [Nitrospirae bacterium]|nr:hypothetical protein [Nitrospirota bacterium]